MNDVLRLVLATMFLCGTALGICISISCLHEAETVFHELVGLVLLFGCITASLLYIIADQLMQLNRTLKKTERKPSYFSEKTLR